MANTLLTTDVIARQALMVLRNNAVMANLVYRDYSSEFVAGRGDTISIRKPATFVANEFTDAIAVQAATETNVPVVMDKLLDVSFAVTAKEMTLSIEDFTTQLLTPAMQAFSDKIDKYLLALNTQATNRVTHASGAVTKAEVITAREYLTNNAVPLTDRNFVYNGAVEADLLNTDLFTNASAVGDDGTALREASLGRKFGLDFYVDQNIAKTTGQTPNSTPAIVFHKNAMALVTRNLALPMGASNSAIVNYDGYGLRVVYGYNQTSKTDTISIDMLCGVKLLDTKMIAVIDDQR